MLAGVSLESLTQALLADDRLLRPFAKLASFRSPHDGEAGDAPARYDADEQGASTVIKARGIYDGEHIRLLEPLDVPPNTEVEVLAPEPPAARLTDPERDDAYWDALIASGLIRERPPRRKAAPRAFQPVPIDGQPISQTIIENRR